MRKPAKEPWEKMRRLHTCPYQVVEGCGWYGPTNLSLNRHLKRKHPAGLLTTPRERLRSK